MKDAMDKNEAANPIIKTARRFKKSKAAGHFRATGISRLLMGSSSIWLTPFPKARFRFF